ncbi:6936_t:CDS:2 [Entrophospora sp. SA101]|nr:6936_t:CDS:2 [Entrophospora sp. SA101]
MRSAKEAGDVITTIRDSSNYKPPYKNPYPYDDLEGKKITEVKYESGGADKKEVINNQQTSSPTNQNGNDKLGFKG